MVLGFANKKENLSMFPFQNVSPLNYNLRILIHIIFDDFFYILPNRIQISPK